MTARALSTLRARGRSSTWPSTLACSRRRIEEEGLRLWRVVQEELGPSRRVAFMSERFCETFTTAEAYERAVALESRE